MNPNSLFSLKNKNLIIPGAAEHFFSDAMSVFNGSVEINCSHKVISDH